MNNVKKAVYSVLIVVGILLFAFWSGYFVRDRQRSKQDNQLVNQLQSDLQSARDRNSELEAIVERDGAELSGLRTDYSELLSNYEQLQKSYRLLGKQLDSARQFIDSISEGFELGNGTIDDIIRIIESIRAKIKAYQDSLDSDCPDNDT